MGDPDMKAFDGRLLVRTMALVVVAAMTLFGIGRHSGLSTAMAADEHGHDEHHDDAVTLSASQMAEFGVELATAGRGRIMVKGLSRLEYLTGKQQLRQLEIGLELIEDTPQSLIELKERITKLLNGKN